MTEVFEKEIMNWQDKPDDTMFAITVMVRPESDEDTVMIWQMHQYESICVGPESVDDLCAALQEAKMFAQGIKR